MSPSSSTSTLHIRCKNNHPKPKEQPTNPKEMPKVPEAPTRVLGQGPVLTVPVLPLEESSCFPCTGGMRQKNGIWKCLFQLQS